MEEEKALPISKYFSIASNLPCLMLGSGLAKKAWGKARGSSREPGFVCSHSACFPCWGKAAMPHLQRSILSLLWCGRGHDGLPSTATI